MNNDVFIKRIIGLADTEKRKHDHYSVYDKNYISPTLNTMQGGGRQPMIIDEPKIDIVGKTKSGGERSPILADSGICSCLSATDYKQPKQINDTGNLRIRKLTPKECWRLMGFTDEEFERAKNTGMSNTQLYKQAGNSIVVNVLVEIFRNLYINGDLYEQN